MCALDAHTTKTNRELKYADESGDEAFPRVTGRWRQTAPPIQTSASSEPRIKYKNNQRGNQSRRAVRAARPDAGLHVTPGRTPGVRGGAECRWGLVERRLEVKGVRWMLSGGGGGGGGKQPPHPDGPSSRS